MGDRTWHEVWVYAEDVHKYAAILLDADPDWVLQYGRTDIEDLNDEETIAEQLDKHEHGYRLFISDINGGGYEYFDMAAEQGLRFHGRTGSGGEYTGVRAWSDGDSILHEWEADSLGDGMVFSFSLFGDDLFDLSVSRELAVDGKPMIQWGDGVFDGIREFLLGLRKMHMMVGEESDKPT